MAKLTDPWSLGGVSQSLLSLRELRRQEGSTDNKDIYSSLSGLTVYDLVHPFEY